MEGTERNGLVEGMGKVDANQVGWLVEVDAKLASEIRWSKLMFIKLL